MVRKHRIHHFISKQRQRGTSLLMVVAIMGAAGIVIGLSAKMISGFIKSRSKLEQSGDRDVVTKQIMEEFDCVQTLKPLCPGLNCTLPAFPTCPNTVPAVIEARNSKGNPLIESTGQRFGQWVVRAECVDGNAGLNTNGIRLWIAAIRNDKPSNTTNQSDFMLDPLTKIPLDWNHPLATVVRDTNPPTSTSLLCKEPFNAAATRNTWCSGGVGGTSTANNTCVNNAFLSGINPNSSELCCSPIAKDRNGNPTEVDTYFAKWGNNNNLIQSWTSQDAQGRVGMGMPPDSTYRLSIKSGTPSNPVWGLYLKNLTGGAGPRFFLSGTRGAGSLNAAQIDLKNLANNSNWGITLRSMPSETLEFHYRPSYNVGVAPEVIIMAPNGFNGFTYSMATKGYDLPSDRRLKTDIQDLEGDVLAKLHHIDGVRFHLKTQDPTTPRHIGVIAQQVEAQFPELVRDTSDGMKSVEYDSFAPVLIESVKVLNKRSVDIPLLAKQVATLRQQIEERRKLIHQLQLKTKTKK